MKKCIFLFIVLWSHLTFAQNLKGVSIDSQFQSKEIQLMFNHLEQHPVKGNKGKEILLIMDMINSTSNYLSDTQFLTLMNSEFYKFFLDNPILREKQSLQVTPALIKSLTMKLEKNAIIYSDFSQFIFNKTLTELKPYLKNNYLNNYISYQSTQGDIVKGNKLKRSLKYLSPWMTIMNQDEPSDFNKTLSDFSYQYFKRIEQIINVLIIHLPEKKASNAQKLFSGITQDKKEQALKKEAPIKKGPEVQTLESMKSDQKDALESIKKLDVDNFEPASEEIDGLINTLDGDTR